MKIDIAAIADYAMLDQSGKMSIIGVFTQINALSFPMTYPRFFVCLRITCRPVESGSSHQLAIRIQDADGGALAKLEGAFQVPQVPQDGGWPNVQAVLELAGVQFPRPGTYSVEIAIDQRHQTSIALRVVAVKPPQPS